MPHLLLFKLSLKEYSKDVMLSYIFIMLSVMYPWGNHLTLDSLTVIRQSYIIYFNTFEILGIHINILSVRSM